MVDSGTPTAFDDIAQLAALLCNTPHGVLLRGWRRSSFQVMGSYGADFTQLLPEHLSVNRSVTESGVARIIPDTTLDSRFAAHPLVQGYPFVRFFASIPVQGEAGQALGALCVTDTKIRELSPAQRTGLETLARQAAVLLRRSRPRKDPPEGEAKLEANPRTVNQWLVRSRFLGGLTRDLMSASMDPIRRAQIFAKQVVPSFADFCIVFLLSRNPGLPPRRVAFAHRDPERQKLSHWRINENFNLAAIPPLPELIASHSSILVERFETEMLPLLTLLPEHRRIIEALAIQSGILVPLHPPIEVPAADPGNSPLGFAIFGTTENRKFRKSDLGLAQELAQRAGLAIRNALFYQRASEAVRGREDLLAMVSHDLRNPLSAITLNARLLAMKLAASDTASRESTKQLEIIRQSSHRMSRLIADLLQLRQLEFTKLSLDRGTYSAASLLEEALHAFESLATLQGIQLNLEDPSPELGFVDCDKDRILQVFSNLLGNAIRFTPSGGRITIRAVREASTVTFSVEDTGPGISQEDLPHLFDRYWHARRENRNGTGLGLAISKGIVENHGCRIWASSQLGCGTSVHFTLQAV